MSGGNRIDERIPANMIGGILALESIASAMHSVWHNRANTVQSPLSWLSLPHRDLSLRRLPQELADPSLIDAEDVPYPGWRVSGRPGLARGSGGCASSVVQQPPLAIERTLDPVEHLVQGRAETSNLVVLIRRRKPARRFGRRVGPPDAYAPSDEGRRPRAASWPTRSRRGRSDHRSRGWR
jgi:hypothetical protein